MLSIYSIVQLCESLDIMHTEGYFGILKPSKLKCLLKVMSLIVGQAADIILPFYSAKTKPLPCS